MLRDLFRRWLVLRERVIFWPVWSWLVMPFGIVGRLISYPFDWLTAEMWAAAWGEPSIRAESIRRRLSACIPPLSSARSAPESKQNPRSTDSRRTSCPGEGETFE